MMNEGEGRSLHCGTADTADTRHKAHGTRHLLPTETESPEASRPPISSDGERNGIKPKLRVMMILSQPRPVSPGG